MNKSKDINRTVDVAAAIIEKDNTFLICQRIEGKYKDLWEFPGGKVEKNETFKKAIEREIFEELSLIVKASEILFVNYFERKEYYNLNIAFIRCEVLEGKISLKVHKKSKFVPKEDLQYFEFVPADVDFVKKIINNS